MAKPRLSIATFATPEADPPPAIANLLTSEQPDAESAPTTKKRTVKSADKKLVAFRMTKSNARQLERMAFDEELTVQDFLLKTINLYRSQRGLGPLC